MHQLLITAVLLIVVYGFGTPLQTVSADSGTKRWGIVTKSPVEEKGTDTQETEKSAVTPDLPSAEADTPPPVPADRKPDSQITTPGATGAKESAVQKAPDNQSMKPEPPDNKPPASKPQDSATKPGPPEQKKIKWDNENQKKVCENYLQHLQEQFLKTRHYSIQGVPCNTADHAEAFMQIADKCEKECPKGLLEQSGYTKRIMRNINWLGKLGNDQCGDTQPVTNTPPKSPSEAPRPKN